MAQLNRQQLKDNAIALLPDNNQQEISAMDVRDRFINSADSNVNRTDDAGQLVPTGGQSGQFLAKRSNTSGDTGWVNAQAGPAGPRGQMGFQGISTFDIYTSVAHGGNAPATPSATSYDISNNSFSGLTSGWVRDIPAPLDTTTNDYYYSRVTFNPADSSLHFAVPQKTDAEIGPQGPAGPQGIQGNQGPKGDMGNPGVDGRDGMDGMDGADGAPGPKGDKGDRGDTGPAGEAGKDGADGRGVPTGGNTGQFLRKRSGTDYDTEWVNAPSGGGGGGPGTQGPTGDTGDSIVFAFRNSASQPSAPSATDYATSNNSYTNLSSGWASFPSTPSTGEFTWVSRATYDPNATGDKVGTFSTPSRFSGEKGDRGAQGERGLQGASGETGQRGPQGQRGPAGPAGNDGQDGQDGAQGPRGLQGIQGPQGNPGAAGQDGQDGMDGAQGAQGISQIDVWQAVAHGANAPTITTANITYNVTTGAFGGLGSWTVDVPNHNSATNDLYYRRITINPAIGNALTVANSGLSVSANIKADAEAGPQGPRGLQGAPGADGRDGNDGQDGQDGARGPAGPQGIQGIQGQRGEKGDPGNDGADGQGLPTGGTTGQIIKKSSATDYATEWTSGNLITRRFSQNVAVNGGGLAVGVSGNDGIIANSVVGDNDILEFIQFNSRGLEVGSCKIKGSDWKTGNTTTAGTSLITAGNRVSGFINRLGADCYIGRTSAGRVLYGSTGQSNGDAMPLVCFHYKGDV